MPKSLSPSLSSLMERGRAFLGSDYAILGGAMTWVSERNLVSALSNAGGFGVLASGSMPPEILEKEILETKKLTQKPFGVNLITMHPQLDELIDVCLKLNISHIFLAGGLPKKVHMDRIKEGGAKVICFAPGLVLAKRLLKNGADALVIEGMEAGGHVGPVSTSILAQEILPVIKEIPVFVAGGIGRGETIVAYLRMGAAGCQLGTRFVVSEECVAHENFKAAFLKANARDAQLSVQLDPRFPVIPVRGIANKGTATFMEEQRRVIQAFDAGEYTQEEAQLAIEHFWAGALRRAVQDGEVETGSLMAGQSVGLVKEIQPISDIFEELISQAELALAPPATEHSLQEMRT